VIEGSDPSKSPPFTVYNSVGIGYFDTLGVRLLRGRDFTDADRVGSLPVAIVNETMAKKFWPGQEALGKRFRYYVEQAPREVVGVVTTSKYTTLGELPQPAAFVPLQQVYSDTVVLLAHSAGGDAAGLIEPVRQEIRRIDPHMPIQNAQVVRDLMAQSLYPVNFAAALLAVFGVLALALACVGLYGVMSYTVGQRTREIGLRMALGAGRSSVMGLVLRQGLTLVGFGVAIGIGSAMLLSKYLASLLYGSASDLVSFVGASAALLVVAAIASLFPALRASRVDPLVALREF
jgi:predicted permease